MCRIVLRVTFIKNVLIDDVSYCVKSYIHKKYWSRMCRIVLRVTFIKNVFIDDVSYCVKSYVHKIIDRGCVVLC